MTAGDVCTGFRVNEKASASVHAFAIDMEAVACAKSCALGAHPEVNALSSNDIITAAFLQASQCSWAVMPVDLRHRLECLR
eukprot:8936950-Pyramimonas_sp.AAC.1